MDEDGIGLTSMAHPRPATWWGRFVSWLSCLRGIRRSSVVIVDTLVIEVDEDDYPVGFRIDRDLTRGQ
jgi:hypothetical protein